MSATAQPIASHRRRRVPRRLLQFGPIVRRNNSWRFGTRRISDGMIDALIADGSAQREGDTIVASIAAKDSA